LEDLLIHLSCLHPSFPFSLHHEIVSQPPKNNSNEEMGFPYDPPDTISPHNPTKGGGEEEEEEMNSSPISRRTSGSLLLTNETLEGGDIGKLKALHIVLFHSSRIEDHNPRFGLI